MALENHKIIFSVQKLILEKYDSSLTEEYWMEFLPYLELN